MEPNEGVESEGGKGAGEVSPSIGSSGEEFPRRQNLSRNLSDVKGCRVKVTGDTLMEQAKAGVRGRGVGSPSGEQQEGPQGGAEEGMSGARCK